MSSPAQLDVKITDEYVLASKDTTLDQFSLPQWALFSRVTLACVGILVGSVWLLSRPGIPDEIKFISTTLAPAAGYKLLETGALGTKGNGGKK